jgi:hypothetical protein
MAHYAFLNEQNIVTEVITGIDETELIEGLHPEVWYGNFRGQVCKRTSYNNKIRKNYAGVGMIYDETRNAFYWPQPYPSWTLNEQSCIWESPTPYPNDGKQYQWNEPTTEWIEII